jgi:monovalent cation:H+ antiporter, CPA1 family
MLPVLTLSTLGVVASAAFVAAGMIFLLSWPVMPSLVFGVLITATDPVAVIALFKDIGVTGRLRLLGRVKAYSTMALRRCCSGSR